MWPFVLSALLLLVSLLLLIRYARKMKDDGDLVPVSIWLLLLFLGLFPVSRWLSKMTTGYLPNYSNGQREGYITKISQKGFIWKTWEIEIQVGTGEMAALQAPHHFSVGNNAVKHVQNNLGNRVVVHYRQWLIMPYEIGDSGNEIMDIELRVK